MNPPGAIDAREGARRLECGARVLQALIEATPADRIRARPSPTGWSALEVLGHLADEEVLDFRARIASTLRDPAEPWPSIAPQDWVEQRAYNQANPEECLARFLEERRRSVEWLRGLERAPWENAYLHPKSGRLSARMLLANWIAHDLLHARQLLRLQYGELAARAAPNTLDYAGPWAPA